VALFTAERLNPDYPEHDFRGSIESARQADPDIQWIEKQKCRYPVAISRGLDALRKCYLAVNCAGLVDLHCGSRCQ